VDGGRSFRCCVREVSEAGGKVGGRVGKKFGAEFLVASRARLSIAVPVRRSASARRLVTLTLRRQGGKRGPRRESRRCS
jgi:hypothetical protein